MITREQSINNFNNLMDELSKSKYLFANAKIFEIITCINSSKLFSDIIKYFIEGFDFYNTFISTLVEKDGEKIFQMPTDKAIVLPFVYSLMREINYKNLQLTDLLDYFDENKNYDIAYQNLFETIFVPFQKDLIQVASEILDRSFENNIPDSITMVDEELKTEENKEEKIENIKQNMTFLRMMDLDKLSIVQSHISKEDKDDILYIWNIFVETYKRGIAREIHLAYLAYMYCLKNFKKVRTNLKEITNLLMRDGIIQCII